MPSRIGMPPLIPPIMGFRRAMDTLSLLPWNSFPAITQKNINSHSQIYISWIHFNSCFHIRAFFSDSF